MIELIEMPFGWSFRVSNGGQWVEVLYVPKDEMQRDLAESVLRALRKVSRSSHMYVT